MGQNSANEIETYANLKLDQQLCFPLYAASRLVIQAYGPYLAELGITYPQYLVLLVMWENDGSSVKEIGKRLYLDSGTLTPILKKLETLKLVRRHRSQLDDRAVLNFITPLGWELRPKALQMLSQLACEAEVSQAEVIRLRKQLHDLIGQFVDLNEKRSCQCPLLPDPVSRSPLKQRLKAMPQSRTRHS